MALNESGVLICVLIPFVICSQLYLFHCDCLHVACMLVLSELIDETKGRASATASAAL